MNRRELLQGLLAGAAAVAVSRNTFAASAHGLGSAGTRLAALERHHGGRLGVAILDTGGGRRAAYRDDERFLLCSTFKLLLVAAVLSRVDHGAAKLEQRIVFGKEAVLDWAPVTSRHVGAPGLTIAELCSAALTLSDNTAANLLLQEIGGPAQVTRYARGLGDPVTRLDRAEPTLNRRDGDKDTTTPAWMLRDMQAVLLGNALSGTSRRQLLDWLLHNGTGAETLRAGLPKGWQIADKTGSGNTANNDIAIIWPRRRAPLLVTAYYDNPRRDAAARKRVLAEVGRIAATM